MSVRVYYDDLVLAVVSAVVVYHRLNTNFLFQQIHRMHFPRHLVRPAMLFSLSIWLWQSNNLHFRGIQQYLYRMAVNCCNHCYRVSLLAMAVESNHLQMLLNRLSLNYEMKRERERKGHFFCWSKLRYDSIKFFYLPIEFLLLLSPDKDIVSLVLFPRIFVFDAAMILVGRDKRFSRSTSERSGRRGFTSSVNSNTGVEIGEATSGVGSFSVGGVNVDVYHWLLAIGRLNESLSI